MTDRSLVVWYVSIFISRGRRGRDHMVVFTTIYTISAYQISIRARCTTLYDKACRCRISPGSLVSSTNKTDRHDILVTDILLKVALNTIKQTSNFILWSNRWRWKCWKTDQQWLIPGLPIDQQTIKWRGLITIICSIVRGPI